MGIHPYCGKVAGGRLFPILPGRKLQERATFLPLSSNMDKSPFPPNIRTNCPLRGMMVVVRKIGKECFRGREIRMSWHGMLEMAHGSVRSSSALSSAYQVTRRTVRRVGAFVAYAEHEWQAAKLTYIERMLDAQGFGLPTAASCCNLMARVSICERNRLRFL